MANLAWAWALFLVHDDLLIETIVGASCSRIHSLNAQDLSNSAWAFARLEVEDITLWDAISSEAKSELSFPPLNT